MKETTLRKKFLLKWQPKNPNGRLFRNNSGATKTINGGFVKYGIPLGGGGSDLIGWEAVKITPEMVGKEIAVFAGYEIKTKNDKLSPNQKKFLKLLKEMGCVAKIVKETTNGEFEVIDYGNI